MDLVISVRLISVAKIGKKTIASKFLGYFFTDENRGGGSLVFFSDQESPLILKREGEKHQNGGICTDLVPRLR